MSLRAFFPGQIVVVVYDTPALARILPPFKQAIVKSNNLLYSVQYLKNKSILHSVPCQNLLGLSQLAPKGMPYRDSKYDAVIGPLLKEIYDNFEIIVYNIFVPAIAFPLGNSIDGNDIMREYMAVGYTKVTLVRNNLTFLGECENKGSNTLFPSLAALKMHRIGQFQILQVGNVVKIGSFIGLVRRLYALQRHPFDNVFAELEMLLSQGEDYMLTSITIQLPLIYEFQVFYACACVESDDVIVELPLLFMNQPVLEQPKDTIRISGIFVPQQQSNLCEFLCSAIDDTSRDCTYLQGVVFKLNKEHVHHVQGIPEFDKEDETAEFPYYLNRKDAGFFISSEIESNLVCQICKKNIEKQHRGCDVLYDDTLQAVFELNRINGVLTCPTCQRQYHPSCYYSSLCPHMTQLSELLANGYSFTGLNTKCKDCIDDQPNYFFNDKASFWKMIMYSNYHINEGINPNDKLLSRFDTNLEDYVSTLRNWHMMPVQEQYYLNYVEPMLGRLQMATVSYISEVESLAVIYIQKSVEQIEPCIAVAAQNSHNTYECLVSIMSCLDSYLEINSNLLFWLQIWYDEQDFIDFYNLEIEQVQQILQQKYGSTQVQTRSYQQEQLQNIRKIKQDERNAKQVLQQVFGRSDMQSPSFYQKYAGVIAGRNILPREEESRISESYVSRYESVRSALNMAVPAMASSVKCSAPLDDKGQVAPAQYQHIFADAKHCYEQMRQEPVSEQLGRPIHEVTGEYITFAPPPLQRQNKFTVPLDLQQDFISLKSGIQQTLDLLQNPGDTELQRMIQSVLQDRPPSYSTLRAPQEPPMKYIPPTEQVVTEIRVQQYDMEHFQQIISFLNATQPMLEAICRTPGPRLAYFPASRLLQREIWRREILELDQRAEELRKNMFKFKQQNEEDVSVIESIRTAMSELKARLTLTAGQLEERQGLAQRTEAELRTITETQALLSQHYCEDRNEETPLVQSDLNTLCNAREALLRKLVSELGVY